MSKLDAPVPSPAAQGWGRRSIGLLLGVALIVTSVAVVWHETPKPNVAILVGAFSFMLAGVVVAYLSPGRAIPESALWGLVLATLTGLVLSFVVGWEPTLPTVVLGLSAGVILTAIGGWVGGLIQGAMGGTGFASPTRLSGSTDPVGSTDLPEAIQWRWVAVGIVLGSILSCYAVFVGPALFKLSSVGVLCVFAMCFVMVGLIVAFLSPGVTLLESALAGLGLVALDVFIAGAGLQSVFSLPTIAVAFSGAFFLSLAGGWVGELAHAGPVSGEHSEVGSSIEVLRD